LPSVLWAVVVNFNSLPLTRYLLTQGASPWYSDPDTDHTLFMDAITPVGLFDQNGSCLKEHLNDRTLIVKALLQVEALVFLKPPPSPPLRPCSPISMTISIPRIPVLNFSPRLST
jgi:hypothetical protein